MNTNALVNATGNKPRRELDYYPTPPDATRALMEFLDLPQMHILEPACGNGAMSAVFESYGHWVASSDIRHTGYGVGGIDFLTADIPSYGAIITNPPFAQAEEFIKKALTRAPIVAMLLKCQYWHAKKRLNLFNTHPPAYILALTWRPDFLDGASGGAPTMDCIWTVWISGDTDTKYRLLKQPSIQTLFDWR